MRTAFDKFKEYSGWNFSCQVREAKGTFRSRMEAFASEESRINPSGRFTLLGRWHNEAVQRGDCLTDLDERYNNLSQSTQELNWVARKVYGLVQTILCWIVRFDAFRNELKGEKDILSAKKLKIAETTLDQKTVGIFLKMIPDSRTNTNKEFQFSVVDAEQTIAKINYNNYQTHASFTPIPLNENPALTRLLIRIIFEVFSRGTQYTQINLRSIEGQASVHMWFIEHNTNNPPAQLGRFNRSEGELTRADLTKPAAKTFLPDDPTDRILGTETTPFLPSYEE